MRISIVETAEIKVSREFVVQGGIQKIKIQLRDFFCSGHLLKKVLQSQ